METFSISFQLAADFINFTNRSLFLTGKAGTGKTTFLKYIRAHTHKQTAVLAPTGVAAINAGGATIHSFFQLPVSPFIPERKGFNFSGAEAMDKHSLPGRIKLNTEKRKILQQLELLIIDEISMVRCDLLDAVDLVLRYFRNRNNEPFGGVQVLLIGDMYQLPPVVPNDEWELLSQFYSSPFFFSSRVMEQQLPAYIQLDKIYRQSDAEFIYLLNQVRNNEMDEAAVELLHTRYQPAFQWQKDHGYIILTTHNYKADATNTDELNKLDGQLFSFKASITGEFYEKSYPADETLLIKVGAQVMFIKNDKEQSKRFFNGKIGTVEKIEEEKIFVRCKNEPFAIEVKKEVWQNFRYTLNKSTERLEEEELGAFTQFPLRLAWAITIHKSQGLTFEKAVIDAGAAFAPGQVYVALSRCTSLQGIVLLSRINTRSLHSDERIVQFANKQTKPLELQQQLKDARLEYKQKILLQLFDFSDAIKNCNDLIVCTQEHAVSFNAETVSWLNDLQTRMEALQEIAKKFQAQLQHLLNQFPSPETDAALQQRIGAAAQYFSTHLKNLLDHLHNSPAIADSKLHALEYNEYLKQIFSVLAMKHHLMTASKDGFSIEIFQEQKNKFIVPQFSVNAYAGAAPYKRADSPHPTLHRQLRILRDEICSKENMPVYLVAGSKTIDEMAQYLPQTLEELIKVSGFGEAKIRRFGQQFLDVIIKYCTEKNLASTIKEKNPKRQKKEKTATKIDTKLETYKLYKEGRSIAEIAKQRNFTVQTIEGHLSHYVQQGEIKIDDLVSREKIILIEPLAKNFEGSSITPIKAKLGNDISFGEIKLVIASLKYEQKKQAF